jgi:CubicO group peptidase (beta-lactamase class C family)
VAQFPWRRSRRAFVLLAILTSVVSLHRTSKGQAQGVSLRDPSVEATRFVGQLDSFIPKRMHELLIPAVAVALVDHGDVAWRKGYGISNKTTGTPATPETVFQAASISKSVTAWGVMRLVQDGTLNLDAPAERYLTRWHLPLSQFDTSGVTIRRLLSHTAGLSLHGYRGLESSRPLPTLEQSLSGDTGGAGGVHLEMQPGTRFSYSGGGYTLLQLIIEEASHEKFSDYMRREVLQPLGMEHSSFEWTPDIQARTASPYDRSGNRLPNYLYTEAAAAGLYTTAVDLAKFVAASMAGPNGEPAGRGVLTPQTIRQMTSPAPATNGTYGLGFQIQKLPGGLHMVYHPGGNPGWGAIFVELPEKSAGVAVLTDSDSGEILATQVAFAFAAQPLYQTILWTGLVLEILLCFFVGWIWLRLRRGHRQWGWETPKLRWLKFGCIMVLALVASLWWLGWYSDLVSRAMTGWKGVIPADEMPTSFRWFTLVVTIWCLAGIASCLTSTPAREAPLPPQFDTH